MAFRFRVLLILGIVAMSLLGDVYAAEAKEDWQAEWEKTVKAAEQEGQFVLYTLSEVGEVFVNSSFQRKFPKMKIVLVSARGGDLVSRIMAERRAEKFLADVGNLGNTSPYRLYQSKVLEPITSLFLLPELKTGPNGGRENTTT